MQQDNLKSDIKKRLVLRYLSQAVGEDTEIPWHIATQLFDTGLFPVIEDDIPEIKKVISTLENHEDFVEKHTSPLFVFTNEMKEEVKFTYVELTDMLAWRNISAAELASRVIKNCALSNTDSEYISELCDNYIKKVKKKDLKSILYAASKLDKALYENWDWQISILKHSCDENLYPVLKRQISRVLGIEPDDKELFQDLKDKFDLVLGDLTEITNKLDLGELNGEEAVNKILPLAGHLPWQSITGFWSTVIESYNDHLKVEDIWTKLEPWLEYDHPAWWYYIWITSVKNPILVPQSAWRTMWCKVSALLGYPIEGFELENRCAERYSKLLEFFVYRLESSLPITRSDFIIWAASKLASDIVSATTNLNDSEFDKIINQAVDDAKLVWQISSPTYPATSLRSAFIEFQTYWPSVFQSSIQEVDPDVIKKNIPEDVLPKIEDMLRNFSIRLSVCCDEEETNISPLLLGKIVDLREEWKSVISDDTTEEFITAHKHLLNQFNTPEKVINRVSLPIKDEDVDGIVALSRFHSFLRLGKITTEHAVDLISSESWKLEVEPTIPPEYIFHIADGIMTSKWTGRETLRVEIPHWAAQQCIHYLNDENRRHSYFVATIFLSMRGNSSSAITRLIFEDNKNVLKNDISNMIDILTRTLNISPAWVAGRIRSVLAFLID